MPSVSKLIVEISRLNCEERANGVEREPLFTSPCFLSFALESPPPPLPHRATSLSRSPVVAVVDVFRGGYKGRRGHSGRRGRSGYSGHGGRSGYSGHGGRGGRGGRSGYSGYSGHGGRCGRRGHSGRGSLSGYSSRGGRCGRRGYSGHGGRSGHSSHGGRCGRRGYSGRGSRSGYSSRGGRRGYSLGSTSQRRQTYFRLSLLSAEKYEKRQPVIRLRSQARGVHVFGMMWVSRDRDHKEIGASES